jgi:hypothetical protein
MTQPFIIFALPRSRTKWLSEWLSYDGRKVGHDILVDCATPDEFLEKLSGLSGTVETSAMLAWRLIRARLPNVKIVTVRRPVDEVRRSFERLGVMPQRGELEERDAMLDELECDRIVSRYDTYELDDVGVLDSLSAFVLGAPIDRQWTAEFIRRNIQIDMPARLAKLVANRDRIENLKRLAREQEAALCLTSS